MDREIWFRLLGQLQHRTPEDLQRASEGNLGYGQLFKQANAYRGKVVTGARFGASGVFGPAPKNSYGIEEYWVYWLQPEGGPNSPILVYALEKPESLPSIEFAELGKKKMSPTPDVEVSGFFFKKYAYQGQGGLFTAPMLLARVPVEIEASSRPAELPNPATFALVAGGLALFAAGLCVGVLSVPSRPLPLPR